jgi:hypothetical protein
MAQAIADNAGSFRINVTIPEGFSVFAPQRFDIIATGESSVKFAYASFQLDS